MSQSHLPPEEPRLSSEAPPQEGPTASQNPAPPAEDMAAQKAGKEKKPGAFGADLYGWLQALTFALAFTTRPLAEMRSLSQASLATVRRLIRRETFSHLSSRTVSPPYSTRPMCWKGRTVQMARPSTYRVSTGPRRLSRLSEELLRLSPMTKTDPSGTSQ